jgi:hypothetical protein
VGAPLPGGAGMFSRPCQSRRFSLPLAPVQAAIVIMLLRNKLTPEYRTVEPGGGNGLSIAAAP